MNKKEVDTDTVETSREVKVSSFILAVIAVAVIQVVYGLIVYFVIPAWEKRGTFGDMFGGVNALFTGLAFAGVIYTILLQRNELKLQREELQMTRKELKRTADAQEKSEAAQSAQVKVAQLSARLNAATALLGYYETLVARLPRLYPSASEEETAKAQKQRNTIGEAKSAVVQEIFDLKAELSATVYAELTAVNPAATFSATAEVRSSNSQE